MQASRRQSASVQVRATADDSSVDVDQVVKDLQEKVSHKKELAVAFAFSQEQHNEFTNRFCPYDVMYEEQSETQKLGKTYVVQAHQKLDNPQQHFSGLTLGRFRSFSCTPRCKWGFSVPPPDQFQSCASGSCMDIQSACKCIF